MSAALKLFADLGVTYFPPEQRCDGIPLATHCLGVVDRLIGKPGLGFPHATTTLRVITVSARNHCALVEDVILAVSEVILSHPRWSKLGPRFIEAFNEIDLVQIRKTAKAANVRPLRVGIATLIAIELSKILGPSRPPKPPARSKSQVMADRLALGISLLRLKADEPERFGALAHELHRVDPKSAIVYRTMAAARLYADRPEITGRVSWETLSALSSPSLPPDLRRKFETAIISGQTVEAPHIRRARQAHATKRTAGQPAMRMAA